MKYILYLIPIFILFGCDIFDTREPEVPENTNIDLNIPLEPDEVFENLKQSFFQKNSEFYNTLFIDSAFLSSQFQFIPSNQSISQYPTLNDWDLTSEKAYFFNLINSFGEDEILNLSLENLNTQIFGDSAKYQFSYNLILPGLDVPFKGTSNFTVKRDIRQQWVITFWEDISNNENESWSDVKGKYY